MVRLLGNKIFHLSIAHRLSLFPGVNNVFLAHLVQLLRSQCARGLNVVYRRLAATEAVLLSHDLLAVHLFVDLLPAVLVIVCDFSRKF